MHEDDYDEDIARYLKEIRVPAGAEERARDAIGRASNPPQSEPSRLSRKFAGILVVAALLAISATAVAFTGVWQTWTGDSEAPVPAAYRELQKWIGSETDLPIYGRRLAGVEYQGGRFEAWVARGTIGPQVVVTGPGLVGEVRSECQSPWPWTDATSDGGPEPAPPTSEPALGGEPFGGVIVYCGASGNRVRGTGHVIASVAPQVASAELLARNGQTYPTVVQNGALLTVFPFTACDAQAAPDTLVLKDSAGQVIWRLDEDTPGSARYLPARSICG